VCGKIIKSANGEKSEDPKDQISSVGMSLIQFI
jgi:hypothetical protein